MRILGMRHIHLLGGQTYTFDEIQGWLTTAGFGRLRRKDIFKSGSPLIMAQ